MASTQHPPSPENKKPGKSNMVSILQEASAEILYSVMHYSKFQQTLLSIFIHLIVFPRKISSCRLRLKKSDPKKCRWHKSDLIMVRYFRVFCASLWFREASRLFIFTCIFFLVNFKTRWGGGGGRGVAAGVVTLCP